MTTTMKLIKGAKYLVLGTSDYPVCDCCGKTNLTRAVVLEGEDGEAISVGVICASKLLRQHYMGKNYKVSADAVLSMGRSAKREGATECLRAA
jgi:hypothetical protein